MRYKTELETPGLQSAPLLPHFEVRAHFGVYAYKHLIQISHSQARLIRGIIRPAALDRGQLRLVLRLSTPTIFPRRFSLSMLQRRENSNHSFSPTPMSR